MIGAGPQACKRTIMASTTMFCSTCFRHSFLHLSDAYEAIYRTQNDNQLALSYREGCMNAKRHGTVLLFFWFSLGVEGRRWMIIGLYFRQYYNI
ncbi:hypothetical protein QCA50_013873 [Cerrena zonata]|uniref:Uncharacterized protein n=1 Tax=Cerrena zonata TaxID=2478898 RepID=A0AAW0G2B8_9APHY